jgi:hypothetical protein
MLGRTTDAIWGLSGDDRSIAGPASPSCHPVFTGTAEFADVMPCTVDAVSAAGGFLSGEHDAPTISTRSGITNFARFRNMGDNL